MSEQPTDLSPTRPYLLRAMHEWMTDNGQTPLILVDAARPGVQVPEGFIEDDHIVLNVSWSATRNLDLGNELVAFEARFAGAPHVVNVPLDAVKGIYARESGQGMMFQDEPGSASGAAERGEANAEGAAQTPWHDPNSRDPDSHDPDDPKGSKPGRPGLRVVK